jgi:hypothetical protein
VDERLRVHGVKDPRAVDAGVFKVMLRGAIVMRVYAPPES